MTASALEAHRKHGGCDGSGAEGHSGYSIPAKEPSHVMEGLAGEKRKNLEAKEREKA